MGAPVLVLALSVSLLGALDPIEVATRHGQAGRPNLALHLLDRLTEGRGDARAQALREKLMIQAGLNVGGVPTPVGSASAGPRPRASATPRAAVPREDPLPLFKAGHYMKAAPIFLKMLEANPQDFGTFSYMVGCYWSEADRLLQQHKKDAAAAVYDEGRRLELMYAPNFEELAGSTAPDGLAQRLGR